MPKRIPEKLKKPTSVPRGTGKHGFALSVHFYNDLSRKGTMMIHRSNLLAMFMLGAVFMLLGGCGSTSPSRFYLLSLSDESEASGQRRDGDLSIEIGHVKLPDYLDRPQIVVRTSRNELHMADFDRWAEPLESNITRVLAGNLSALLSSNHITFFPKRAAVPTAYRVEVDVTRFESGPEGIVSLDACWALFKAKDNQLLLMQNSCIRKPAGDEKNYAALVSAKSDALGDLSREIAESIKDYEASASE
jgi:hypothetical protein